MSSVPASFDPPWPQDAVEVGKIVDAWGIKGGIKVLPFASDPQALFSTKRWFLKEAEIQAGRVVVPSSRNLPSLLKVIEAKEHGDVVVAQVQDVTDRSAAEALRGARVFVGRSSFPTPDIDEYYWVDLIGLEVINREGERLGSVIGLLDAGPHSILRVQTSAPEAGGAAPAERLIPFVAAYIDDVSLPERRITVDWGSDY